MGRSFLSVKLAVVFGVFVAVLVTVHGHVTADVLTREEAVVAPSAVHHAAEAGEEAFACMWRGCPVLSHPLLRASAPAAGQRARGLRAARGVLDGVTKLTS